MRKAFIVRIVSNRPQAIRVPVRPFTTDKRGVRLLACCRGALESSLMREYELAREAARLAGMVCQG